jgi:hypothetical protein
MMEVLGIISKRRYFTLLHTQSGVQFFDGIDSGDLIYPATLTEFKRNKHNRIILEPFEWEGYNLRNLPHILLFDQRLERVGVVDYKQAVQLLTFDNEDEVKRKCHHDVISSEEHAVNILHNWLSNKCESNSCRHIC